jgi:hypothetical protein
MRLADLKKVAIRKQTRIRFTIPGGLDCVVNEHGIAQVPELARTPDFNLETALASASRFTLEPVALVKKKAAPPQHVTADQLAAMAAGGTETSHPDEHDE